MCSFACVAVFRPVRLVIKLLCVVYMLYGLVWYVTQWSSRHCFHKAALVCSGEFLINRMHFQEGGGC